MRRPVFTSIVVTAPGRRRRSPAASFEREGALGLPGSAAWWGAAGQAEVIKNSARDALVDDDGDEPHVPVAARADQNLPSPRPAHQVGPRQPTRAGFCVGAAKGVRRWRNSRDSKASRRGPRGQLQFLAAHDHPE
jgi:hypothetical protein